MARKLKLFNIHLIDGTILLARKSVELEGKVIVYDPLIVTRYRLELGSEELQLMLSRYDNFNSDKKNSISINSAAIVSMYQCEGDIVRFYDEFLEANIDEDETIEDGPSTNTTLPILLIEDEVQPVTNNVKKIDFAKLRSETIRVVVDNDEETE